MTPALPLPPPRPGCATCRHFTPRSASGPWPVAGVPRGAEGRCGVPGIDPARPRWRRGSDWCASHTLTEPDPGACPQVLSAPGSGRRRASLTLLRRHLSALAAWRGWPFVGDAIGAAAILALWWMLFVAAGVLS